MTQEAFIKVLDKKDYSYEIEGDRIIVTYRGRVFLESLTSLPPGVEFKNGGSVFLKSFTSLPPGVEFKNGGSVQPYSKFNIKGIDPKRLLNVMIKQGVFI